MGHFSRKPGKELSDEQVFYLADLLDGNLYSFSKTAVINRYGCASFSLCRLICPKREMTGRHLWKE